MYGQNANPAVTVKKAPDFAVTLRTAYDRSRLDTEVQHQAVFVRHSPQSQCRKEIHKPFKRTARILFLSGQDTQEISLGEMHPLNIGLRSS